MGGGAGSFCELVDWLSGLWRVDGGGDAYRYDRYWC